MNSALFNSIRLAHTHHGEVRFATDGSQHYWFSFRHLDRCLTGAEFHRFHHTVMAYLGIAGPIDTQVIEGTYRASVVQMQPLPTCLSQADLRELRHLLGRAALMFCVLSRAYNDLN